MLAASRKTKIGIDNFLVPYFRSPICPQRIVLAPDGSSTETCRLLLLPDK